MNDANPLGLDFRKCLFISEGIGNQNCDFVDRTAYKTMFIADFCMIGHYREIPFKTGHVDFHACLSTFWKLGVRMYTAEFWYDKNTDAMEILKYNQKFLSQRIEESA